MAAAGLNIGQGLPLRRWLASLACALCSSLADAGALAAPFVGSQPGDVAIMLDLAAISPADYLIDLGAGDGRIVIEAARRGTPGHGVEINRHLVDSAREGARDAGVDAITTFIQGDIFEAPLRDASVITLFLMPEANLRLRPRLLTELAPGSRIVSNRFDLGDWEPDQRRQGSSGALYLWHVPARVQGSWRLLLEEREYPLELRQDYQKLQARLQQGRHWQGGALQGRQIHFALELEGDTVEFRGWAGEHEMSGTALLPGREQPLRWRALP